MTTQIPLWIALPGRLNRVVHAASFEYELPQALIAQTPASERDKSRLFVLNRQTGEYAHREFPELLEYLRPTDVLVLNNSRVIRARLRGVNQRSGGELEVLLLHENARNDWWVMLRPGRRARSQTHIVLKNSRGELAGLQAIVVDKNNDGHGRLRFSGTADIAESLETLGEVPLPPYIKRSAGEDLEGDRERYQTVYAQVDGSVAAPTAGLHFTKRMLEQIRSVGVQVCCVTLHVGLGTFAPVKSEILSEHLMHEERYYIDERTAHTINAAKHSGQRVIAVGTTSVRALEAVAAQHKGRLVPGHGHTRIFIYPPFQFRIADAMLTNFHLPRSTLLMLVSAFATPGETHGRDLVLAAYAEAVRQRYRFFSYGDAMLLI